MPPKNMVRSPGAVTLRVLGGKWTVPILWSFYRASRPLRFADIKRSQPRITQRMLARRLQELQAYGILSRKIRQVNPLRVEYEMTARGRTLWSVLFALRAWEESSDWNG